MGDSRLELELEHSNTQVVGNIETKISKAKLLFFWSTYSMELPGMLNDLTGSEKFKMVTSKIG